MARRGGEWARDGGRRRPKILGRWSSILRLAYELKKELHEVAGWRGPTTRRQLLVWMAWLPVEKAKIEFQPIVRKPSVPPPDPRFILTKDKIREMNKRARIQGLQTPKSASGSSQARLGIAAAIAGRGKTVQEPR